MGGVKSDTCPERFVALGSRLAGVPEVRTLGVKPNFTDYTPVERDLILNSNIILYPTLNYAQFLKTLGREIFPSLETYLYSDEKIMQTTLFQMLGIPHPRTRFYYPLHHCDILKDFSFPFVGKIPRSSSQGRGVFLINSISELDAYLGLTRVAYIQEYLFHFRDLRVVLINYDPVLSYWRERGEKDFRTNLSQGGRASFKDIPDEGVQLARRTVEMCRFNDVGLDLIQSRGKWYVIEANMKFGRKALKIKGMDIKSIMRRKLVSGEITGST